jgi:uncharacterized phiE125 gp8 family phage protein
MALTLVTTPTAEPLSVGEVKQHLRLDDTSGEPVPTALTAALAGAGAGNVDNGAHRYLVTFVTADGETNGGTISAALTVADKTTNGQVALTNIPLGGSAVTARNVYRTAAGGSTYLRQSTIANNTATTATDNVADANLGVQAPTVNTTLDPEISGWITAARQLCETITHRAFITQTWDLMLDGFPMWSTVETDGRLVDAGAIWLPKPPLQSVTSVSYVDTSGATQVWSAANYTVDAPSGPTARMGRVTPGWSIYYPVAREVPNAVTVRFVAGYGATGTSVPFPIKAAMKLLIGNWWQNREAATIERASADVLPLGVDVLLWPYKAF